MKKRNLSRVCYSVFFSLPSGRNTGNTTVIIIITENRITMPRYKIKWHYFIWFLLRMMFGVSWSLIILSQHSRMKWRFSPYEKLNNTCTLIGSYIWSIEWQTHSWHNYFQYFALSSYKTNRFHVAVSPYSSRSQKTSKCGKNIVDILGCFSSVSHVFVLITFWCHLWFITEHVHGNRASICDTYQRKF